MVYLTRNGVQTHIETPMTPNFIKVDGVMRPLSFLSVDDLREVIGEWGFHLLAKAAKQRDVEREK